MKTILTTHSIRRIQSAQRPHFVPRRRRQGFTLLQLVVVVAIIGVLAAILLPVIRNSRTTAQRAQCDVNVKTIALALDAYRQENGRYPTTLDELITKKYIKQASFLHCPSDPRPNGTYKEFYVPRAPRNPDSGRLANPPILVCPFHEEDSAHGVQAFIGLQTKQFSTRPAVLISASGATLYRPGKEGIPAIGGMELHGGDRIKSDGNGTTIRFADGTTCVLEAHSDITVLQSFMNGASSHYSLVNQASGAITYTVNHGSGFDVVTPAATAGALGTKFKITVNTYTQKTKLEVLDGQVYVASFTKVVKVSVGQTLTDLLNDILSLPSLLLGGLFG